MINKPIKSPTAVPKVPAVGKKVVPGMINAPQPTLQPNAKAQTPSGDKYFDNFSSGKTSLFFHMYFDCY